MNLNGIQDEVRHLFQEMSPAFKAHLMHSFLWTEEQLQAYLSTSRESTHDALKDAYSHLESLLARIESYAAEELNRQFPSYEQWVETEYHAYRATLRDDSEDISRLMDEGGVYAPGRTTPDTMESDSMAHYRHSKKIFEDQQKLKNEALQIMKTELYQHLKIEADEMNAEILKSIH